jgi:hypothetical protein
MHVDEGPGSERDRENGRAKGGPGDRIGIGGGDDAVVRIQLAARWSEANSPNQGDSLAGLLKRFRVAYEYLDAVTHGVEPPEIEEEPEPSPVAAPTSAASYGAPPPSYAPSEAPPAAAPEPPAPESEPRPWG